MLGLCVLLLGSAALAQATPESRKRCATRLSINMMGVTPSAALIAAADPQTQVDAILADQRFIDAFANFINAKFNPTRGLTPSEDATYWMARKILMEGLPWKQMFIGNYSVKPIDPAVPGSAADIQADPNGIGYFTSPQWMSRYAGNEKEGYRIVTAYQIINNVLGVELVAALNTDGTTATDRAQQPCAQCHFDNVFGLDLISRLLPRKGPGAIQAPQVLLGGQSIASERDLITKMVNSVDFNFQSCRLATEFLYGRGEYQCEGPVFDACMAAFASTGKMQSALAAIAKHSTYCQ